MGESADATTLGAGGAALVAVGRIVRTQGRRGEVRVEPLTDAPERLAELRECWLVPPAAGERREVETVCVPGAGPRRQAGRERRPMSDAEALVGRLVAIPRGVGAAAAAGSVLRVRSGRMRRGDPRGREPRHDHGDRRRPRARLLDGAARRSGRWSLPAVAALVERVDLAARRVVARPPEGLAELDA